jgi:flagellar hook capping protein FlgD
MTTNRARCLALFIVCLLDCLLTGAVVQAASPQRIRDVSVDPPSFNASAKQFSTITFYAAAAGTAQVSILDRDRFPVRTLKPREVTPGLASFTWDGRDDSGAIVPDEAWNIRIELAGETYDPSLNFHPVVEDPQPRTYSRADGILSYTLKKPARVHVEAGQAALNPKSGKNEGPILKTIVNREPRVAGAVIEKWNGFDESGTIRVSDLEHFVVGVLATSLPDNSIITRGNRREAFLEYASRRRPAEALVARKRMVPVEHHTGLDAFEDRSPSLRVTPAATWDAEARAYTASKAVRLDLKIEGVNAAHFLAQPGRMSVYVDETRVLTRDNPSSPLALSIPEESLPPGEHRIAVNWGSDFGPSAATSFRINVPSRVARARTGVTR